MRAIDDYTATFGEDPGYLNWAAFGPLSPAARAALVSDADLLATGRAEGIAATAGRTAEAQAAVAGLLGSAPGEVTVHPSSTHALQQALAGLDGTAIASAAEFPSVTITLERAAAASVGRLAPRWITPPRTRVTADTVADALDPAVTALVVSHVDFRSGYRADLAALREALGEDRLLIVDAVQSFGVVEEDWAVADVVVGHGYKWLRAGRGTGFARFTDRARERIRPVLSGRIATVAAGLPTDALPDPALSAQAYAVSAPDPLAAGRLAAGAGEIRAVGVDAVAERLSRNVDAVLELADRHGIEVLSSREPAERAGIVVLAPAHPQGLGEVLAAAGIEVTVRSGAVRVAPHAGTTAETLGLLDAALADAREFTRP
ncbi:MAG: aminotransferase class V-fold PLP-dependent enzyme [Microbacterium sp.]|jgi:selenocysteine lyase/cysteine desulfurase|uniref:aminotransferase class V-fold PLP-dependent enzyme n=1 Tax=Microbacterium sp. TaxID=51671 RepID=UPI0028196024|nr:aminotransferase class V-fold PLP-dependent enzyme [Microbacterium sp.]MDR2321903.1 aminotransferase class V-fold PLP-dependent enzyme [Microbacterium sp.]